VDLTLRHPSFESAGAASQPDTLWTASPAAVALLMHGNARQTRGQFIKRWSVPAALIVVLHIVGGFAVLRLVDRPPQPPVPVHALTIALIAPPAPPVEVPTIAPPDPKPVPKPTPKSVVKHVTPRPQPVVPPSPVLVTQAPAATTVAAPPAAAETPAPAPAKQPDATPAPSTAPSHASSGAPVTVSHLTCDDNAPAYPLLSKRHGETGTAIVALTIDTHGAVTASLRSSSGFPRLDEAALEAARGRVCQPYLVDGNPVVATATQKFSFNLQD
jgi:periplasmic protein TonB